jgi:branched-chain amino acid transport system substrate-binding protein
MRTKTRSVRIGAVAAGLVLLLGACGSDDDPEDSGSNETTTTEASETPAATPADENGGRTEGDGALNLGAILPQSGRLAVLGPPMIQGGQMAIADINEAGGVLGQDATLSVKDDGGGTDDDLAATATDELINNDKVDGILGAASSDTTKAVIDRVTSSGTVQCSPSNTGSDLTTWEDEGLYFRTAPPDNLQAQALAKVVSDDGHQNVAIIAQNTDYGTGFVEFLDPALTDNGAEVVENITYEANATSFDAEVETIVGSSPDAVVLVAYPEDGGKVVAEMIKQSAGPADVPLYVTDGMQANALYELIDESDPAITAGVRGTAASAAPEDGASFFPDAFAAFAPEVESPIYSAQSYDCIILMALAAVKAESDAPFDIAAEMINVSSGETDDAEKCSTFADCIALLQDDTDIDYDGASGALDFSEYGEPSAGSYDVFTFGEDGDYAVDEQVVVGS